MIATETRVASMRGFADLLVTFGGGTPSISRSGKPWRRNVDTDRPASVWTCDSSADVSGPKPLLTQGRTRSWTAWMVGELFGYRDLNRAAAFDGWCNDLQSGNAAPTHLNGHFLMLARDERDGAWHAWTNRLGTVHLYYGSGANAAVGTFHPAVAESASSKKLDLQALAAYFAFGFCAADRTFFEDIKIVRPATHAIWDGEGRLVSAARYWNWEFTPDTVRSYDDTVDAFGETLTDILHDLSAEGRLALPISSGLDSRTIAAVLSVDGPPANVWSYSYGYARDSAETRIAARIAAVRRLPFVQFTISPYLFDRLDTALATAEGFQSVTSTRQLAISEQLAAHADYLLAGHWGDVWMDDMGLASTRASLADADMVSHCFAKIAKPGREWLLKRLFADQGGHAGTELLRHMIGAELKRLDDIECLDFRVKAYKTDQWSFRWTVPSLRTFQTAVFPRLPFYDNRMVDLSSTIPASFLTGRRLQIDFLKRHHPDLARVTWDVTDSSLFRHQHYNSWLLPKRAAKKLLRAMRRKPVVSRNWEVQFLSPGMRRHVEAQLLEPGLRIHDVIQQDDLRALVAELYTQPTRETGYAVSQVLTVAAWLERYA